MRVLAIIILALAFGTACWFLYQKDADLTTEQAAHSVTKDLLISCQRALSVCQQGASNAKDKFEQQLSSLTRKQDDNKRTVASTPLARRLPAIRKNLVAGGFLPPSYGGDTSSRIRVTPGGILIDIDTVEAAAIQESTGLVTIKQQAWDDLAKGYGVAVVQRDQARDSLRNCQSSSLKAEDRFLGEAQTKRFLGGFGYNARKRAARRSAAVVREIRESGHSATEESELERALNRQKPRP